MNYHNITHNDMLNGEGLRTVLWLSGCTHNCPGCHNPQTHDVNSGIPFNHEARLELLNSLKYNHISGVTFSGGDPLHERNINGVGILVKEIKEKYPDKNIWLYTGYTMRDILDMDEVNEWIKLVDVVVDGKYVERLKSPNEYWIGSRNQKIWRRSVYNDFDGWESGKKGRSIISNEAIG